MNLRDKLRSGGDSGAEAESAREPEVTAKPTKAAPKRSAKPAVSKSVMPKLDVNKRFLAIAGAAALVTSLTAVMYLNNAGSGLEAGGTKVKVLAPKDDMPAGTRLTEDNTQTVEIPKAYLSKGYVTDFKKLEDHLSIAPMVAGEPILEIRISAPDAKYGIAYLLKRGERAKTITVDSASGLAGLIKPGNEVDMIATIPDPNNEGRRIGAPVIQKARVIAVGNHLLGEPPRPDTDDGNKGDDSGISSNNTVTLAIPGTKIGLVTLLEDLGNLKIVLRAANDDTLVKTPFSDDVILSLVSGKIPTKPVVHKAAPPKPQPHPHVSLSTHTFVSHEPPPRPVHHTAAPHPHPAPVHHDPPPIKPKPPVVHHTPAPVIHTNIPEVIRFGGGGSN